METAPPGACALSDAVDRTGSTLRWLHGGHHRGSQHALFDVSGF